MAFKALHTNSYISFPQTIVQLQKDLKHFFFSSPSASRPSFFSAQLCLIPRKASIFTRSTAKHDLVTSPNELNKHIESPFSGVEDVMMGYIFGRKKATEVAHEVWKNVVRKGDVVIDATCGNGYDTLAMLRLVADAADTRKGRVFAMDLQKDALESTSLLLDRSVSADERELVELYAMCHTQMEDIVPNGRAVRLIAFNLGYLPGGDKNIKTESETTIRALEAATRIIARRSLISVLAYVGHSGGREEFERVQCFAAGLAKENWVCFKLEMLNRPFAPVLVLLSKR